MIASMDVTEVVRGADLLLSTFRQLLLYRALDLVAPQFFHAPLVTDSLGKRLAKRHDALSLRALRAAGFYARKSARANFCRRAVSCFAHDAISKESSGEPMPSPTKARASAEDSAG